MIIQMLGRKIGKHGSRKGDPFHPSLLQRLAAYLHHHCGDAVLYHLVQDAMQFGRRWGGIGVWLGFLSPHYAVRPNAPGLDPGALQQVAQQVGGSGLAVGAGNADDSQFFGRLTPIAGTQTGQRRTGIRDGIFPGQAQLLLGHYGGSTPPQHSRGIGVAIVAATLDANKDLIFYFPAAIADGFHLRRQRLQQSFALNLPIGSVLHGSLLWVSLW